MNSLEFVEYRTTAAIEKTLLSKLSNRATLRTEESGERLESFPLFTSFQNNELLP